MKITFKINHQIKIWNSTRITSEELHDAIHLGSTSILLINIWEKWLKVVKSGGKWLKVGKSGEKVVKSWKSGEKVVKSCEKLKKWGKVVKKWWNLFAKWPAEAILEDRKSLSIAFLAISDQYDFFFKFLFSKWPPAAILDPDFCR